MRLCRNKTESSQRRKTPHQAASLTSTSNSAISTNGNSDFDSGDETQHHTTNGYSNEPFPNPSAINVDSDATSTSSQTSSEHDPQVSSLPTTNNPTQTYQISPNNNWSEDQTSIFTANNLPSSQLPLTPSNSKSLPQTSPSIPVNNHVYSSKTTHHNNNNNLLTESTNNNNNHHHHHHQPAVKTLDQVPEYKLFSSNGPSIHNLLFGNNENGQQSRRTLINGNDHDVREIEKRLMGMGKNKFHSSDRSFSSPLENGLSNGDSSSYSQIQENDELGRIDRLKEI